MTAPAPTTRRRAVGRPSKLRPDTLERILEAVRNGATVKAACMHAGIGQSTIYRWLERADQEDAPPEYRQLREELDRARADLQVDVLSSVMETIRGGALVRRVTRVRPNGEEEIEEQYAPPDGRLGLDLLSRLFPTDFARRNAVEVTGPAGGPVQVTSIERLTAIASVVKRAIAQPPDVQDAEVVDDNGGA